MQENIEYHDVKEEIKMIKLFIFLMLITLEASLGGCGIKSKDIRIESTKATAAVFNEVKEESPIPQGFAEVVIKASIKTHEEGHYWFEPKETMHGKQSYPFLINIDGQSITWQADGKKDNAPEYDERGNKNIEGGVGIKYLLEKKIRITAGTHVVSLRIPEDNIIKNVKITFKEGGLHVLEFKPVYKQLKLGRYYHMPFLYEIEKFNVSLDGESISDC